MTRFEDMTTERLHEIYNNLKTSAQIVGFASKGDSEMMVVIEIELAKRNDK